MAKAKMDPAKKTKLIYSGELVVFSVIFLVIGFFKLFGVIGTNPTYRLVFSIITSCGALFMYGDFLFSLINKKRRAKVCLLDKIINLPAATYLIVYNILSFLAIGNVIVLPELFYKISMAAVIFYLSGSYCFQGIYHYFNPTKELLEAIQLDEEERKRKALEEANKAKEEETKSEDETK